MMARNKWYLDPLIKKNLVKETHSEKTLWIRAWVPEPQFCFKKELLPYMDMAAILTISHFT